MRSGPATILAERRGQGARPERGLVWEGDLELARRAAGGDRSAFHAVVDRHAQPLFRIARGLCPTADDAEDVVQETFLEAYKGIGRFDGRSSLLTWLSRILARRAGRMWRRTGKHRAAVPLDAATEAGRPDEELFTQSAAPQVDRRLDLLAAIRRLGGDHREVLVLREMQGLSYAEIAATLGIPQGTVESRLHRARRELRDRLRAYAP